MPQQPTIWTVGHSTRPIDEFIDLLRAHEIRLLVDVRTIPRSRHNPQFNTDRLALSVERCRPQLSPHAGVGRPSKAEEGFHQQWMAQCQFSRVCRLYADGRILECNGRANDAKSARPKRDHVRGSCPVALPPIIDRRCAGDVVAGRSGISCLASQAAPHILTSFAHHREGTLVYPKPIDPPSFF